MPRIRLEFKLQDCWIGFFWKTEESAYRTGSFIFVDVWVCLVPMLPIHISWNRYEESNRVNP